MAAAFFTRFADAFSYSNSYNYNTTTTSTGHLSPVFGVIIVLAVIVAIITVVAMWKLFTKAGKPGWAAIVPIYNFLVLLDIVGRPWWWILLLLLSFIPFVGGIVSLVVTIIVYNDLAKSFGKTTGYTVLLVVLPFIGFPMLAFGDATYKGPAAKSGPSAPTAPTVTPTTHA